ncbi:family 20 glycosylhydrolase [Clostridium sp. MCC353]|uniref:family 20 glycosylhydrolase n=1 Tax=Clostridium sp. MCC353 TaxID=2592646 RepID=UPI001C0173BD|nr:family 20 glycosylhydrolase [Clostridium sp. MCC353]MBT9775340.1 family 20 glycosylhydrolase [Clostridium sp. MCC353]
MEIHIIPQPRYVVSEGEKSGLKTSGLEAELSMPQEDERLVSHAKEIFAGLTVRAENRGCYSLVCNIKEYDPVLADRSVGKTDGYSLRTGKGTLELYADTAPGLFYGMMTVKQLTETYGELPQVTVVDWADMKLRSDYLDLRTIYPTYDHMLEYIGKLAEFKLNTLVIEYEDKLPFQKMKFLCHPEYAFTMEEFQEILETARRNFIKIIPLQQSFGHLEYVLKHEKYRSLREIPQAVGEMCPLRQGALELSRALLEETAALHPQAEYLHIGCDEVWSLGSSRECMESGKSREEIFIEYVNRLVDMVCALGKKPVLWHDMIARCGEAELSRLDKRVIAAVWIYNGNDLRHQAVPMIRKLRKQGIRVLGAGAVRSGDGNGDQNYPVVQNRIPNLDGWSRIVVEEQLEGMINTNWASPFSLGRPYGLYESAFYTIIYGAERCWNQKEGTMDFLDRFFHVFHGVPDSRLADRGYMAEDYYNLIPQMCSEITRNQETARLIEVMRRYEHAMNLHFPAHSQMFRLAMFPGREEEALSLRAKADYTYRTLEGVKKDMEEAVSGLLRASMADLFLRSRFYLPELYERNIRKLLEGQDE